MCCKKHQFEKMLTIIHRYVQLASKDDFSAAAAAFVVTKGPFINIFSMKNSFDVRPLTIQQQGNGHVCLKHSRTLTYYSDKQKENVCEFI